MHEIQLDGRLVAWTVRGRAILADEIAALDPTDVRRRFAMAMCVYALDCDEPGTDRPYADEDAEAFARDMLIPAATLLELWVAPDVQLAKRFDVPLAQLTLRRYEVTSRAS